MTLAPPTWTLQKTYEYFAVSNVNVKKARELKNTGNFSWAKTENGKCFTRSEACCGDVLPLRQVKKKKKKNMCPLKLIEVNKISKKTAADKS